MLAGDRVSGADADRHEDISHNGSSGFGDMSTTIWSGGAAAGLYLSTGLVLAFLVHTYYPGALRLREWIRVVLCWPLIF
jgi:hypothetical protein